MLVVINLKHEARLINFDSKQEKKCLHFYVLANYQVGFIIKNLITKCTTSILTMFYKLYKNIYRLINLLLIYFTHQSS